MKPLVILLLFSSGAIAQSQKSQGPNAFAYEINVKESIVQSGGKEFRKVEYRGDIFYLQLLDSKKNQGEVQFECGTEVSPPKMPDQVLISTKVTKRSSLFISGLKQTCEQVKPGQKKMVIDPNIKIGFFLNDQPGDVIKNKSFYIAPFMPGVGFGGEF